MLTRSATAAAATSTNDEDVCCVCLDPLSLRRTICVEPCDHKIHWVCTMGIFFTNFESVVEFTCSLCRGKVTGLSNEHRELNLLQFLKDFRMLRSSELPAALSDDFFGAPRRMYDYIRQRLEELAEEKNTALMDRQTTVIIDEINQEIDVFKDFARNQKNMTRKMTNIFKEIVDRMPTVRREGINCFLHVHGDFVAYLQASTPRNTAATGNANRSSAAVDAFETTLIQLGTAISARIAALAAEEQAAAAQSTPGNARRSGQTDRVRAVPQPAAVTTRALARRAADGPPADTPPTRRRR